jgi:hypothetical protein
VPALDSAVAFAEVHHTAPITHYLYFDVPHRRKEAFDVDRAAPERGRCLRRGPLQALLQRGLVVDDAHATSTAAGGRLDQHGEAHTPRDLGCLLRIADRIARALTHRDTGVFRQFASGCLVAH